MTDPRVSVIMSVYNGEKYLSEAIESVLRQTYKDFEFIIIDDGSGDNSLQIAEGYASKDKRIRIVRNEINLGLAHSLNKGIDLARGEFVARMDCDDISLPERFQKQVAFFEKNPLCCTVATRIERMEPSGRNDVWRAEKAAVSAKEIRRCLPKENCIAHPTVMIRTDTISSYRYNENLTKAQDYELWLRIYSDGLRIDKLNEPLLKFRRHENSLTMRHGWYGRVLFRVWVKIRFFFGQMGQGKIRGRDCLVLVYTLRDLREVLWRAFKDMISYLLTLSKALLSFQKGKFRS